MLLELTLIKKQNLENKLVDLKEVLSLKINSTEFKRKNKNKLSLKINESYVII